MSVSTPSNLSASTFGYSLDSRQELGFYIICNDKQILDNINTLMRRRGLVGVSDTAGRLHYLVDARQNIQAAAYQITKQATGHKNAEKNYSSFQILEAVEAVLSHWKIDRNLSGGRLLRFALLRSIGEPNLLSPVSKGIYPLAAKEFSLTTSQVERNIRYTLSRSEVACSLKGAKALRLMYDQIIAELLRAQTPDS